MRKNIADLRYQISVGSLFLKQAMQRQVEYPLYLVSWLIANPLQYFFGVLLLKVLVDRFHPLAGWTYQQLAFLYGLGLLSHGLNVALFIQFWNVDFYINDGGFDRMLVRPLPVFFQFCTQYFNFIGFTDLIPGVTIFIYACHAVEFVWTPASTVKLILVVIGGVLLRAGLYLIVTCSAFWTSRSYPLVETCGTLFERGTLYPLSVYPFVFQCLLTFLLPMGFIAFYPACDFLGKGDSAGLPLAFCLWTPIVGGGIFLLAMGVFRLGLTKYESAGS